MLLLKPAVGSRAIIPRGFRLPDTIRRVELDSESPLGDILPFVQFTDKRWTLCVDCVTQEQVDAALHSLHRCA